MTMRDTGLFALAAALIVATGFYQSWNVALAVLNMGLISAIMALGLNMQWGYAGLFNAGVMGFVALGGLATVIVSAPSVPEAWDAGGLRALLALALGAAVVVFAIQIRRWIPAGRARAVVTVAVLGVGLLAFRLLFDPAAANIEKVDPASTGFLGGLDLPILLAWPAGGLLAACAAWLIGRTALGLRSDYLAIATLGIAEIVIAVLKNEEWLSRGVKNVIGLPRPVPYEIDLQQDPGFIARVDGLGLDPAAASSIAVKLAYAGLFAATLGGLLILAHLALNSPWGRMMRAIRDNEVAAGAMGKDVTRRHLQIFVLGSAVCGLAGAMMTTLDGQLTPNSYQPLRFTFLIWVMVIVGGSGNNLGAVLGGFLIWFFWVQAEPIGGWLMDILTAGLSEDSALREHLRDQAAHTRYFAMGLLLLIMLRFWPRGLIPER